MGLSHSIFEDTLLLMVLGAHISGIFWARLAFSLLVIFILAKLIKVLPVTVFNRYFVRPVKVTTRDTEVNCC